MDIKTWAGIVKIVTYVAAVVALVFGYMKPETVITITLILSAAVKLTEAIVAATPSKEDDAKVAEIVTVLKEKGLVK